MIKKIINEYGGAIGVLAVIFALIALALFFIGTDDGSIVGKAMSTLITGMTTKYTP